MSITGRCAQVYCSGDNSRVSSVGEKSIIKCTGENCIISAVSGSVVSASLGSWITLTKTKTNSDGSITSEVITWKVDGECIFPEYNLIVEIDSNLHNTKYDNARDDYIRSTWGFNILRFFEFGSNPSSMGKYLDRLDQAVSQRNRNNAVLDYSDYLENWFITKFPEIYNLIDQIELDLSNYIGVIKSIKLYDILQKTDLEYLQKNKLQFKMLRRYFKIIHKMGVIIKP